MTAAKKILDQALALPADERAALVDALSASLEEGELSVAWKTEIARRIDAIERGDAKTVPWEEVRAEIRAKLAGR